MDSKLKYWVQTGYKARGRHFKGVDFSPFVRKWLAEKVRPGFVCAVKHWKRPGSSQHPTFCRAFVQHTVLHTQPPIFPILPGSGLDISGEDARPQWRNTVVWLLRLLPPTPPQSHTHISAFSVFNMCRYICLLLERKQLKQLWIIHWGCAFLYFWICDSFSGGKR